MDIRTQFLSALISDCPLVLSCLVIPTVQMEISNWTLIIPIFLQDSNTLTYETTHSKILQKTIDYSTLMIKVPPSKSLYSQEIGHLVF